MNTIRAVRDLALVATLVVSSLASTASAGVIVVNAFGGGQFTTIQPAVNAAVDGDTLLVKAGQYSGFTIDGKGITIVADSGANVSVTGLVSVINLPSARTAVIGGMSLTGAGYAVIAINDTGEVRIQDCTITGAGGDGGPGGTCNLPSSAQGYPAASIGPNTGGVAFARCTIRGGHALNALYWCCCDNGKPGGNGLEIDRARVSLYDCAVIGGRGGDDGCTGGHGGVACRVLANGAYAGISISGSTVNGGGGGIGNDYACGFGGAGGEGLVLGAGTQAWLLDNALYGGNGGNGYGGLNGPNGAALSNAGACYDFGVPSLKLSSPAVVREGGNVILTLRGAAGSSVYLMTSSGTPFIPLPAMRGVLLAGTRRPEIQQVGTMPPSGQIFVSLPISLLPAGVDAERRYFQAFIVDPAGAPQLGGFNVLTVLDSAY